MNWPKQHRPRKDAKRQNDSIACLLKLEPREAYIDDLINGHFYINAADNYHGLPGGQGNPFEASMAPRVRPIMIP